MVSWGMVEDRVISMTTASAWGLLRRCAEDDDDDEEEEEDELLLIGPPRE